MGATREDALRVEACLGDGCARVLARASLPSVCHTVRVCRRGVRRSESPFAQETRDDVEWHRGRNGARAGDELHLPQ